MAVSAFAMAAHIYSHAFSAQVAAELITCQVCDSLASASAPGAAVDLPEPEPLLLEVPVFKPGALPAFSVHVRSSRAPPAA